jgi:hypothetical protein
MKWLHTTLIVAFLSIATTAFADFVGHPNGISGELSPHSNVRIPFRLEGSLFRHNSIQVWAELLPSEGNKNGAIEVHLFDGDGRGIDTCVSDKGHNPNCYFVVTNKLEAPFAVAITNMNDSRISYRLATTQTNN